MIIPLGNMQTPLGSQRPLACASAVGIVGRFPRAPSGGGHLGRSGCQCLRSGGGRLDLNIGRLSVEASPLADLLGDFQEVVAQGYSRVRLRCGRPELLSRIDRASMNAPVQCSRVAGASRSTPLEC